MSVEPIWQHIPLWAKVGHAEFSSIAWQNKNTIIKKEQLFHLISPLVSSTVLQEIELGLLKSPMNIRLTPYIFSLMDWGNPYDDAIRKQYLPFLSEIMPNHPYAMDDSLNEVENSPVPLLVHKYHDRVLFLPLTVCPVYCQYCTRSRLIGGSTNTKTKEFYGPNHKKWEQAFEYIRHNQHIDDVIISGGDAYMLSANNIKTIGYALLDIPHVKKIRYATKGIAVLPMKIFSDTAWVDAVSNVSERGRGLGKEVCIHTHFNHPKEITSWTENAMNLLFKRGLKVRNQTVLINGVNNRADILITLIKKLSAINIQPYYIFLHDFVSGCEQFRTTLKQAIFLDKAIQSCTAGYNTPSVVCDLPGGGGKRRVASFETYNEEYGISVWTSPQVKPGKLFYYFDPIHQLSMSAQRDWQDSEKMKKIILKEAKDLATTI